MSLMKKMSLRGCVALHREDYIQVETLSLPPSKIPGN